MPTLRACLPGASSRLRSERGGRGCAWRCFGRSNSGVAERQRDEVVFEDTHIIHSPSLLCLPTHPLPLCPFYPVVHSFAPLPLSLLLLLMAPVTPRKQQATAAGSVTLASRSRRALVHSLVTPERSKVDKASTPVGTRKRKNTEINNLVHLGAAAADGRGNCQSLQEEGEPDSKQHERGLLAAPLELAAVAATKKRKVAPPINNTTPNRTSTPTGTATTAPVASTSRTSRLSLNAIKSIKPVSANAASYSASRRSIVPAPTPTTGTTVSTTTSTARTSRQHRDEQTRTAQELEAQEWKKKYRKAFKSFIFYFDALEDSKRREADACVKELGAVCFNQSTHPYITY